MTATQLIVRDTDAETEVVSRKGHSTNLVGIPTGLLASDAFNRATLPLRLAGVREANHGLFALLDQADSTEHAATLFTAYMEVMFGLHPEQRGRSNRSGDGRRRYRSSYARLIRGWAHDSNGPEGAVLKGWVESRFGLFPTFHKKALRRFSSAAWMEYVEEKMGSRFHSNAIFSQLDLVYEFAQWSLARFQPRLRTISLYRGVNDFDEHPIVEIIDRRLVVVRLNNLVSFTSQRDIASWFGSYILEAEVPSCKVLFFNGMLPQAALKGEGEYLVIGGDYRVRATYF
ncbi:MAG: NAD(+)--dinitrogen-reductase ADP-D-ribosyltransferase [Rhodospirillales bacterium]|nr:NAD(+)--dinitrogen-reductase ADP-D-ribosyltransferase [Rhodospirillales bacterium]